MKPKQFPLRQVILSAMLAGVSCVLFLVQFSTPLTPSFLKLDVSDLPALLAALTLGAPWGVLVCLVKNIIGLLHTSTMGVGELSNFILSAAFVLTAGLVFRRRRTRGGAIAASLLGALVSAGVALPSNLLLVYPLYVKFLVPLPVIMGWYQAVLPGVSKLWQALLVFNVPFTLVKGLLSVALTALIYLPLKPAIEKFFKRP